MAATMIGAPRASEDDNQDCCAAHDDCIEVQCFDGPAAGWNLGPGDPDDAEEDDPTENNHDAEQPQYPEPRRDPPSITMPHPSR